MLLCHRPVLVHGGSYSVDRYMHTYTISVKNVLSRLQEMIYFEVNKESDPMSGENWCICIDLNGAMLIYIS